MSGTRTNISERLLQMLHEIEANELQNPRHDPHCDLQEILDREDYLINRLHSRHQSVPRCPGPAIVSDSFASISSSRSPAPGLRIEDSEEGSFVKTIHEDLNFAGRSASDVTPERFVNTQEHFKETQSTEGATSTEMIDIKTLSTHEDGEQDYTAANNNLLCVAKQLEIIRDSQDAILDDIRMDMDELYVNNLQLRQNNAKLLAERNHYEKLYHDMCKNLNTMKEHIRIVDSRPLFTRTAALELGDTTNAQLDYSHNETIPFSSQVQTHFVKDACRSQEQHYDTEIRRPEVPFEVDQHQLRQSPTNGNRHQDSSLLEIRENSEPFPLAMEATANKRKRKPSLKKQLSTNSQTSEISQTESTVTAFSEDSVSKDNSSGLSNVSLTDSTSQVKSESNKSARKGKTSKAKTGCFEFLRRNRTKKKGSRN